MNCQSIQFLNNLKTNINSIKSDLLGEYLQAASNPEDPDPFMLTSNSRDDITRLNNRIRSFYLIIHAEIQGYLEYLSKGYLQHAYKIYDEEKRITELLLFFATSNTCNLPTGANFDKESDNKSIYNYGNFKSRYKSLSEQYFKLVKENNGVKLKDCIKLFYPLGISLADLESLQCTFLLDDFGDKRGDYAHKPYHEAFKGNKITTTVVEIEEQIDNIIKSIEEELIPKLNILVDINPL